VGSRVNYHVNYQIEKLELGQVYVLTHQTRELLLRGTIDRAMVGSVGLVTSRTPFMVVAAPRLVILETIFLTDENYQKNYTGANVHKSVDMCVKVLTSVNECGWICLEQSNSKFFSFKKLT
jgi:hypothetical protein